MARSTVTVQQAMDILDDRRVKSVRPLIPPQILLEEQVLSLSFEVVMLIVPHRLPLSLKGAQTVIDGRTAVEAIVSGDDDRLLVVVGPCSIHDPEQALTYARQLKTYADAAAEDLCILMRVYFEKPRTTVGWKGLINDPDMNGTFAINKGLRIARNLLLDIAEMGLPTACEFLDTISPQFTADLTSWGAIGARTTESQVHRELASALSMSIGFKNGTDGSIGIAIDAMHAAASGHTFLSVTKQGLSAIVETNGNPSTHVILRGSSKGPNFAAADVKACADKLAKAGLPGRLMIDCSHGNSQKQHIKQMEVGKDVADQLSGSETPENVMGVMIESNINEGKQSIGSGGRASLKYGVSVTDACLSWDQTVTTLDDLRRGVQARRANIKSKRQAA